MQSLCLSTVYTARSDFIDQAYACISTYTELHLSSNLVLCMQCLWNEATVCIHSACANTTLYEEPVSLYIAAATLNYASVVRKYTSCSNNTGIVAAAGGFNAPPIRQPNERTEGVNQRAGGGFNPPDPPPANRPWLDYLIVSAELIVVRRILDHLFWCVALTGDVASRCVSIRSWMMIHRRW